jgi:hypothetical protein
MHPDLLLALADQRTRELRERAANRKKSRGAGRLKVQASSTPYRRRISAACRAGTAHFWQLSVRPKIARRAIGTGLARLAMRRDLGELRERRVF